MFKIVNKQILTPQIKRLDIKADLIARRVRAGQFVTVVPEEGGDRIPLSVIDWDRDKGTVSVIFHEGGPSTRQLGLIPIGEEIFSVLGPLGRPSVVSKEGLIVCVGTGSGTAQLLPICRHARGEGNKVIGVLGARTRRDVLLEPQMRLTCHNLRIATEDGSFEKRGLATDILADILKKEKVDLVYAVGSFEMMRTVCEMTRAKSVRTLIQTNTHILCGMGICSSCRIRVDGKIVRACQEGPEFDAHQVDFSFFKERLSAYARPKQEEPPLAALQKKVRGMLAERDVG